MSNMISCNGFITRKEGSQSYLSDYTPGPILAFKSMWRFTKEVLFDKNTYLVTYSGLAVNKNDVYLEGEPFFHVTDIFETMILIQEKTASKNIDGSLGEIISRGTRKKTKGTVVDVFGEYWWWMNDGYYVPKQFAMDYRESFELKETFSDVLCGKVTAINGASVYDRCMREIRNISFLENVVITSRYSRQSEEFYMTDEDLFIKSEDVFVMNGSSIFYKSDEKEFDCSMYAYVMEPNRKGLNQFERPIDLSPGMFYEVKKKKKDIYSKWWYETTGETLYLPMGNCLLLQEKNDLVFPKDQKDYYLLATKHINQMAWHVENGCEAASLLMGLQYKGYAVDMNYGDFVKQMPIDPEYNPYNGFGGSPYKINKGRFEAIFPRPLEQWGKQYGKVIDISGATISQLKKCIIEDHPVVVYVTIGFGSPKFDDYPWGTAIANNHAVLLDGVYGGFLHINDPIDGPYWISEEQFTTIYELRKWAVGVF